MRRLSHLNLTMMVDLTGCTHHEELGKNCWDLFWLGIAALSTDERPLNGWNLPSVCMVLSALGRLLMAGWVSSLTAVEAQFGNGGLGRTAPTEKPGRLQRGRKHEFTTSEFSPGNRPSRVAGQMPATDACRSTRDTRDDRCDSCVCVRATSEGLVYSVSRRGWFNHRARQPQFPT